MKKLIRVIFIVLGFSILTSAVMAQETRTYTLDELYMQVSIPTNLIVFTQNIQENDPNLSDIGLDKNSLEEHYRTNHIFLNAISVDNYYEYIVTMTDYDGSQKIFNYNLYDDQITGEISDEISDEFENEGFDVTDTSFYKNDDIKYLVLNYTQDDDGTLRYSKQFNTIYNGLAINITLHSYSGAITTELENELNSIVDSVAFTETLPIPSDTYATQKSGMDWSEIIGKTAIKAVFLAVLATIFGTIKYLSNKHKKKTEIDK